MADTVVDPDPIVTRTDEDVDAANVAKADDKSAKGKKVSILNAGSVDNEFESPDAVSQATGNSPDKSFPAPTPTRDSAVHQLHLKIAELKYHVSDWNHTVDEKTQALIDHLKAF